MMRRFSRSFAVAGYGIIGKYCVILFPEKNAYSERVKEYRPLKTELRLWREQTLIRSYMTKA
jgi:hypothetical protein